MRACRVVRNKITAHTDVDFVAGSLKAVDIAELGLKWSDIGRLTAELQEPIAALGHVVRGTSFAWDMLETRLDETARGFWVTPVTSA